MPRLSLVGQIEAPRAFAALVRCDGHDAHAPADETVCSDRVWFALRGRFALRNPRVRRAGDPETALLLRRDEPFAIRHPDGGGDLCLSVGGTLVERLAGDGATV